MKQKKEFEIFAFSSPYCIDESFQEFAECGFTMAFLDWNEGAPGTDTFDKVMGYCDKYQLKAMPMILDGKIASKEKICLKKHPSFYGLHVWDEPHTTRDIDELSNMLAEFKEKYGKEYCFYVNLAPNCPLEPCKYEGIDGFIGVQEYIDYYIEHVLSKVEGRKIFSVDFYPISTKYGENWLKREWLKHLEVFGMSARKNDFEFFVYLASVGGWHDDPAAEAIGLKSVEIKDIEYLRLQGFIDMCYGATGIGFFTYKDQNSFEYSALVGKDGKHKLYYDAKTAILEFKYLAKLMEKYKWACTNTYTGKIHTDYAEAAFEMLFYNKNDFKEIVVCGADKDTVIGEFINQENKQYAYLLSTYSYPENVGKNKVEISLKNNKLITVYDVVNHSVEKLSGDNISITLQNCGAKLIII